MGHAIGKTWRTSVRVGLSEPPGALTPDAPSTTHLSPPKATPPDLAIAKERTRKAKQLSLAHGKVVAVLRYLRGESYAQKTLREEGSIYGLFRSPLRFLSPYRRATW